MNDTRDIHRLLLRTVDGRSVIFWSLVFMALLVRAVVGSGFELDHLKYLFFSLVELLVFIRFRVSSSQPELETNIWGLFGVNGFGLFVIFMEFSK